MRRLIALFLAAAIATGASAAAASLAADTETQLTLAPDDVIPTGNDWIALPSIRARRCRADGLQRHFDALPRADRVRRPRRAAADEAVPERWRRTRAARQSALELARLLAAHRHDGSRRGADRITYVAPPDSRAAIIRFQVTNLGAAPVKVAPGMEVNWARTNRVTYSPEPLDWRAHDVADARRQRHGDLQLQDR